MQPNTLYFTGSRGKTGHSPPSLLLFSLDDISKYVVTDVENLFTMYSSVLAESIRRALKTDSIKVIVFNAVDN